MIPKVIYQTWYTKSLPNNIKELVDQMLIKNDKYDYHLFDDEDMDRFIFENFDSDIITAFRMLNIGAAKADFWRYLVLYKNGGIYLDIDSEIYGDLDLLIGDNDHAIITRERNTGKFVQWCLMFSPNHPLLEICINNCKNNIFNKTTDNILDLTGPNLFTKSINEYCEIEPFFINDLDVNKLLDNKKLRIYSFDYDGFCRFKNQFFNELYTNKKEWREEVKSTNLFN